MSMCVGVGVSVGLSMLRVLLRLRNRRLIGRVCLLDGHRRGIRKNLLSLRLHAERSGTLAFLRCILRSRISLWLILRRLLILRFWCRRLLWLRSWSLRLVLLQGTPLLVLHGVDSEFEAQCLLPPKKTLLGRYCQSPTKQGFSDIYLNRGQDTPSSSAAGARAERNAHTSFLDIGQGLESQPFCDKPPCHDGMEL